MRMALIGATALTLSAAALAQDYGKMPVDDSSNVAKPDLTMTTPDSGATVHADHDPLVDDMAPDAATTAPAADTLVADDKAAKDMTVAADTATTANLQTFAGMGGPYEEVYGTTTGALDLSPRPASQNYPPCSPGPGDDRCIQLYEPGVRMQLASWNQTTGGLADGSATTAMGGPYEPVGDELAMADKDALEPIAASGDIGKAHEPIAAADDKVYEPIAAVDGKAYEPLDASLDDGTVAEPIAAAAVDEEEPALTTALESDWADEDDVPPPASPPTGTGLNSTSPYNPTTNPSDHELKQRFETEVDVLDEPVSNKI